MLIRFKCGKKASAYMQTADQNKNAFQNENEACLMSMFNNNSSKGNVKLLFNFKYIANL